MRALHRSYRPSIRVSICERARHFIQGGRRACAISVASRSINNYHHTDFHPSTPASSCSDVARVLRAVFLEDAFFLLFLLLLLLLSRTAPAISMGALGVIKQLLCTTPTTLHTRIRTCEDLFRLQVCYGSDSLCQDVHPLIHPLNVGRSVSLSL